MKKKDKKKSKEGKRNLTRLVFDANKALGKGIDTRGYKEAAKAYDKEKQERADKAKAILKAKEAFFGR